tara:strand:+ start:1802 stop:2365 length:564 start_codon:yes stop_codon:yes gene_type:complete
VPRIRISELKEIIAKQDYRCNLTNRKLSPENASADHIKPVSQGGAHAIENIQILDKQINTAKGTMSNKEFVCMCIEVVKASAGRRRTVPGLSECNQLLLDSAQPENNEELGIDEIAESIVGEAEGAPSGFGQIDVNTVYAIERFMEVTGIKRFALDTARRNGLTVRKVGRRCFIYGQDFIGHLVSGR